MSKEAMKLAKPEQTISMTEYKRLQDLVTSQGIRLMEYESAHPKQEPFCYYDGRNIVGKEFADHSDVFPLYTAPTKREWVGLTEEDEEQCHVEANAKYMRHKNSVRGQMISPADNWEWHFLQAIEAKLKEKNT